MASPYTYLKTGLFTILVPGTVAVAIPRALRALRPYPRLPIDATTSRFVGNASLVLGTLTYLHTAWRFADEGEGTPSPTDEPEELVTGGLYAHVRNPMYVGVLLIVVGQALRHRSVVVLWWAAGCWIGFHNRVLGFEEPHLAEKHGETFERYCERVPRWIPRLRPPR